MLCRRRSVLYSRPADGGIETVGFSQHQLPRWASHGARLSHAEQDGAIWQLVHLVEAGGRASIATGAIDYRNGHLEWNRQRGDTGRHERLGEDWASFVIDGSSSNPQLSASPPSSTAPPVGSSSQNSPSLPAPSSSYPPQAPIIPSAIQKPPVFTATLTTNHATTHAGKPVRITITFKNTAKTSQLLALDAATDGITVLHGSTVIAKISSTARTHTLKSGKSLQLTALWNGKPNQAGVTEVSPGIYTIEFDEGSYSASGQIRIA
jgi:hypothetical protein